jgi:hypothetical protein
MSSSGREIVGPGYLIKPAVVVMRPGPCEGRSHHVQESSMEIASCNTGQAVAVPAITATSKMKRVAVEAEAGARITPPGMVPTEPYQDVAKVRPEVVSAGEGERGRAR